MFKDLLCLCLIICKKRLYNKNNLKNNNKSSRMFSGLEPCCHSHYCCPAAAAGANRTKLVSLTRKAAGEQYVWDDCENPTAYIRFY